MYARFFRWASDRVEEKGIVADGFRKRLEEEFSDIYLIDLGGDVRSDPRLSGSQNSVFNIQTVWRSAFW